MNGIFSAGWRAAAYCLHPRVILWSLLPVVLAGGVLALLGWLLWEGAVTAVRATLEHWQLIAQLMGWLESIGVTGLRTLLAPLILVALMVPLVVMGTLLLVAVMMTPAIVELVAKRRFPQLERRRGGSWWAGLMWSLGCALLALVALVVSLPLWLVRPLVMVLPPLIWGWLTYRVLAYDVLAEHASAEERRQIMRDHRWQLLTIGVVCGYLGAAPSLLWATSAATLIFAPMLVVLSVWPYTLVFAFAACWFAHYALAALQQLRLVVPPGPPPVLPPAPPHALEFKPFIPLAPAP